MKNIFLILLGCFMLSCGSSDIETVVVRGSDTEVNLVLQLAEEFMDNNPNVSIAVTGGGSGTGIASLINKKADIANSSRAFKDSEVVLAKKRGVDVVPVIFAVDALSFIVNKDLPVDSLSVEQIRDIYTGIKTNWKDFGGPDMKISLYGRQGNSGTFTFIQQNILKANYSQQMKQMNGTSQIIEGVKNDPAGIGYAGIGYVVKKGGKVIDGVKPLSIRDEGQSQASSPVDFENIKSGAYSIVRPLYQYTDGKPKGLLKKFLEFELSERGQFLISEGGYFPISSAYKQMNHESLK